MLFPTPRGSSKILRYASCLFVIRKCSQTRSVCHFFKRHFDISLIFRHIKYIWSKDIQKCWLKRLEKFRLQTEHWSDISNFHPWCLHAYCIKQRHQYLHLFVYVEWTDVRIISMRNRLETKSNLKKRAVWEIEGRETALLVWVITTESWNVRAIGIAPYVDHKITVSSKCMSAFCNQSADCSLTRMGESFRRSDHL